MWPIQLWLWRLCVRRTHPVGGERSSVGHQVSDFVILTFPGRLQQTLPQVHQRHLHQHTHWKPLLSQNQPGNSIIKWPCQPHDDDVSLCIPTLSVWNLQYLLRPVRWNCVTFTWHHLNVHQWRNRPVLGKESFKVDITGPALKWTGDKVGSWGTLISHCGAPCAVLKVWLVHGAPYLSLCVLSASSVCVWLTSYTSVLMKGHQCHC